VNFIENVDNNLNNGKREDLDNMPKIKKKSSVNSSNKGFYIKTKKDTKYIAFSKPKTKSSSGLGLFAGLFVLLGIIIATNPFFANVFGKTKAFTLGLIFIIIGMIIFGASL